MKKLKFNVGAVVNLYLSIDLKIESTGKVLAADADEIIIMPQTYVAANEEFLTEFQCCTGDQLDPYHSVNCGSPIHIDRSLIVGWSYFQIPCHRRNVRYVGVIGKHQLDQISPGSISTYSTNLKICEGIEGKPIDK